MIDEQALAETERASLVSMFTACALAREIEADVTGDPHYMAAADSLTRIAASVDQIGDDVMVKLSSVNSTSEGALASLIGERAMAVGFMLPLYENASGFFKPLVEQVDAIIANARKAMN